MGWEPALHYKMIACSGLDSASCLAQLPRRSGWGFGMPSHKTWENVAFGTYSEMLPYTVATKRLQQRRAFIHTLKQCVNQNPYTRIFHMIHVMGEKHKIGAKGILNVTIMHKVQQLFYLMRKQNWNVNMFACRFPHWSFQECQEEDRIRKTSADSCGNSNEVPVTHFSYADLVGWGEEKKNLKVRTV